MLLALGIQGLFKGMGAKLWQTVLTAAFQFFTYEKIKGAVTTALLGEAPMTAGFGDNKKH